MGNIDKLLSEYSEQFDEAFPVYSFSGNDSELEQALKKCMETNEPYEAEYDNDVDY